MERYSEKRQERAAKESPITAFQQHSDLHEIGQIVELQDRFGITNPKLLAKALRISEFRAKDIVEGMARDTYFGEETYE